MQLSSGQRKTLEAWIKGHKEEKWQTTNAKNGFIHKITIKHVKAKGKRLLSRTQHVLKGTEQNKVASSDGISGLFSSSHTRSKASNMIMLFPRMTWEIQKARRDTLVFLSTTYHLNLSANMQNNKKTKNGIYEWQDNAGQKWMPVLVGSNKNKKKSKKCL